MDKTHESIYDVVKTYEIKHAFLVESTAGDGVLGFKGYLLFFSDLWYVDCRI